MAWCCGDYSFLCYTCVARSCLKWDLNTRFCHSGTNALTITLALLLDSVLTTRLYSATNLPPPTHMCASSPGVHNTIFVPSRRVELPCVTVAYRYYFGLWTEYTPKWFVCTKGMCTHWGDVYALKWCLITEVICRHWGDVYALGWCVCTDVVCRHLGDVYALWRCVRIDVMHTHWGSIMHWEVMCMHWCDVYALRWCVPTEVMCTHWGDVYALKWCMHWGDVYALRWCVCKYLK